MEVNFCQNELFKLSPISDVYVLFIYWLLLFKTNYVNVKNMTRLERLSSLGELLGNPMFISLNRQENIVCLFLRSYNDVLFPRMTTRLPTWSGFRYCVVPRRLANFSRLLRCLSWENLSHICHLYQAGFSMHYVTVLIKYECVKGIPLWIIKVS